MIRLAVGALVASLSVGTVDVFGAEKASSPAIKAQPSAATARRCPTSRPGRRQPALGIRCY